MSEIKRKNKDERSKERHNILSHIPIKDKGKILTEENNYKNYNQEQKMQILYLNTKIKNFNNFIINILTNIKKSICFISTKKIDINCFYLIFIFLIMLNIQLLISKKIKNNSYLNSSNITIKIHGTGPQNIFSSEYSGSPPDIIFINDIKIEQVKYNYDFNETNNVIELVWYNSISNCNKLFHGCSNIIYVDLSNFDFSLGISANVMFAACISLKTIIFPSSIKLKMTDLGGMFSGCISLISLDLSNFDTTSVTDFGNTFKNCWSLVSLNLKNFFQTSSTQKNLYGMFSYCKNLIYINLDSCLIDPISNSYYLFKDTRNLVICTDNNSIKNIVNGNNCIKIDCSKDWQKSLKRFDTENNICIDNCQNVNYKFEYLYKCYDKCPDGTYNNNFICESCHSDCKICDGPPGINNSNCKSCISPNKFLKFGNCVDNCENGFYIDNNDLSNKICKCDLKKCFICSKESLENNLCISCNDGYYQKYEEININNNYINCYQSPEGYYLDKNNDELNYKLCYESCKICNISGNETYHNCLECKYNFSYELHYLFYKNCYNNCSFYHYFDKEKNIYFCTEAFECPNKFKKLIYEKRECINKCDDDEDYKYEFRNKCWKECPKESKKSENITSQNNYYCEAICSREYPFEFLSTQECLKSCSINDIKEKLCILNYNYKNDNNSKEGKEDEFIPQKILIENVENDFTSINYNTSSLEEGKDDIIKDEKMTITLTTTQNQKNNLNNNSTIVELGECESLLREKYKINDNEVLYMKKIDIKQEGMKIPKIDFDVFYKTSKGNLEKLDLSICEKSKISLLMPVILNESLDKLNSSSGYYNDICYIATSDDGTDISLKDRKKEYIEGNKTVCQDNCVFSEYDYKTNKAKCSCNVKKSSSKFDLKIDKAKLYENFINFKNIVNVNLMVCYKVLFSKEGIKYNIAFFSIIPVILFKIFVIIIFYQNQKNKIVDKINDIFFCINNLKLVNPELKKKNIIKKTKRKRYFSYIKIIKFNEFFRLQTSFNYNYINNNLNKYNYYSKKNKNKSYNLVDLCQLSEKKGIIKKGNNNIENNNQLIINKIKEIMNFNEEELNSLPYELALKHDKRAFCEFYLSLLKTKHIIFFTFFMNKDYNLRVIKIDLFLINFIIDYNINALFFDDDTLHTIYKDKGSFDFVYQLPQIVYSTLISMVVNALLSLLALSESNILEFKKIKTKINLDKRAMDLVNKLKNKFILYFIFSSIILIFAWYYLSMFGAIYRKTQYHLIKDTLISFGFSIVYPLGIYFLPCIFRILSLSKEKKYFYKLSSIFQIF